LATFLIITALILAPVGVLLYYFWVRDRWEREPWSVIMILFGAGCLSVLPAAVIEFAIQAEETISSIGSAFYTAFIVAGTVEELVKFAFIYLLTFRSKYFREEYDGIIYAVAVGLGFAFVEDIFYAVQAFSAEGAGFVTVLLRAFTAVPSHALDGVIMGFFLGRAHFMKDPHERRKTMVIGIMLAILFHGFYDFFAFLMMVLPINLQGWCITGLIWIIIVQWATAHRFVKTAQRRSCNQWGFDLHPTAADLAIGPTPDVPQPQHYQQPEYRKPVPNINFCRFCGARIHPHANFCRTCGKNLTPPP